MSRSLRLLCSPTPASHTWRSLLGLDKNLPGLGTGTQSGQAAQAQVHWMPFHGHCDFCTVCVWGNVLLRTDRPTLYSLGNHVTMAGWSVQGPIGFV